MQNNATTPSCHEPSCHDGAGHTGGEHTPERGRKSWLKNTFNFCAPCVGGGGAGAIVSHLITCVALPAALGTAFSGAVMTGGMLIAAPLIAVGVGYALDKIRGHKTSFGKLAGSAVLAFGIAAAYLGVTGHKDHGGHDHHDMHDIQECPVPSPADTVLSAPARQFYNGLDSAHRAIIDRNVKATGMTLARYLNGGCYSQPMTVPPPAPTGLSPK